MTPILEIQNLHKNYGRVCALRGVDLDLPGPGIYGFLGPNGAGKTTTIKLVAGLLKPSAGCVRINGIDVAADPVQALRCTGLMMEMPRFYGDLTGPDTLRVLSILSGRHDQSRSDQLLARVGLFAKAGEKVSSYSRGMKQRLGLAAGLLDDSQPRTLEGPTHGLAPAGIAG